MIFARQFVLVSATLLSSVAELPSYNTPAAGFTSLATNSDGSAVYFVTTLPQKRSGQTLEPKLFRLSGDTLSLVATRPATY